MSKSVVMSKRPHEVSDVTPRDRIPRSVAWILVAILCLIHFLLAWDVLRRKTPTVDEIAHLPAGLSYLDHGTMRMYRHNPPLPRLVAAAAAELAPPALLYERSWLNAQPANHWQFAFETLALNVESPESRARYLEAFTYGRTAMAAWSALTIPFLFAWGSWWFGRGSGLLAAALWTISPNIVAHAGMVTTDLAATSAGLIAAYVFARWLHRPTWLLAVVAGVVLGLAELTKFSELWLYILFPIWAVGHAISASLHKDRLRASVSWLQFAAIVLTSFLVINVGYLFEGTFTAMGDFPFLSRTLTRPRQDGDGPVPISNNLTYQDVWRSRTNRFQGSWLGSLPCPLPYHYVAGFDEQKFEAEGKYPMYLRGEFADPMIAEDDAESPPRRGWWYYYLYALAVKVPVSTWLLFVLGCAARWTGRVRHPIWPLVLLAATPVVSMSVLTDINLGLRYVLPTMPFVYLICGAAAAWVSSRVMAFVVGGLLVWNVAAIAFIHPNELTYFNELVGGPKNGRFHLIDSNIDWGQDLRGLSRWLQKHSDEKEDFRIAYMGSIPPEMEGIEPYTLAPRDLRFVPDGMLLPWENRSDPTTWGPLPGKYAVSVNFERGMRFHTPAPLDEFLSRRGQLGGALMPGTSMIEVPRGSYAYFQELTPTIDPEIGYSILLYDVSLDEANRVRRKLGLPELPQTETP